MGVQSWCLLIVNHCHFDPFVAQLTVHGHHPLFPRLCEIIVLFTHIVQSFPLTHLDKKWVFQPAQHIFIEIIIGFTCSEPPWELFETTPHTFHLQQVPHREQMLTWQVKRGEIVTVTVALLHHDWWLWDQVFRQVQISYLHHSLLLLCESQMRFERNIAVAIPLMDDVKACIGVFLMSVLNQL